MSLLDIHTRTFDNGLRVVVCPNTKAPVVSVNVTYHVGSINERRGKTGLAHLFEHLMFDNTRSTIEKQYDKYCTRAGGSNNAYTTYDHTCYYINLPSHQLELGLWLEAQRMGGFAITDHALTTQRNVVIEEIKQNVENQPYMKWNPTMDAAAYSQDSSYSWNVYGSIADVAGVTMDDVHDFYNRFYHPGNAVLVIAGDVEVEQAYASAKSIFGEIESRNTDKEIVPFNATYQRKGVHEVVTDDVPLPAVFLAFHIPGSASDAMYDADLIAGFLGSGKRAVLYRDLVAAQRIASGAGCFIDKRMHSSLLITYAYAQDPTTTPDELANAMIKSLTTTPVLQADRDRVVNRIRTSQAAGVQTAGGVSDQLAWITTFLNNPDLANQVMDNFAARTRQSMQDLLSSCIVPDQAVRVDIIPAP